MPSLNKRKAGTPVEELQKALDFNLEEAVTSILTDRSNSNLICDILRYLQAEDFDEDETALACIGLEKWFRKEIEAGVFKPTKISSKMTFCAWVQNQLKSYIAIVSKMTKNEDTYDLAFQLLIRFYKFELDHHTEVIDNSSIQALIAINLLNVEEPCFDEIEKFEEFFIYPDFLNDFLFQAERALSRIKERNDLFVANVIALLNVIEVNFPHQGIDAEMNMSQRSRISLNRLKSSFQKFLVTFLSRRLTDTMTKKILLLFESYYQMLPNPPIVADYITNCYQNSNLSISLLALHSLFKLMTDHNYEYPLFYQKLYSLLSDDIVYSPSRVRFFHLLDLFLASPLLPLTMQAAFTKRLSRLTLHSPAPVVLVLLPLIFNQLRRNQALRFLANAPTGKTVENDPYDHSEQAIENSKAMDSSLWEIETLRKHFIPEISKMANLVSKSLGISEQVMPTDIRYEKFLKVLEDRKDKDCHLAVDSPDTLTACDLFTDI